MFGNGAIESENVAIEQHCKGIEGLKTLSKYVTFMLAHFAVFMQSLTGETSKTALHLLKLGSEERLELNLKAGNHLSRKTRSFKLFEF